MMKLPDPSAMVPATRIGLPAERGTELSATNDPAVPTPLAPLETVPLTVVVGNEAAVVK